MSHGRFNNPVEATLTGVLDIFRKQGLRDRFSPNDNLNGKTCLVTGANSGLGFAIATQFSERGANVIMACRRDIPEAGEKVKQLTGSGKVEMIRLDLTDLKSIHEFCDELESRNIKLDVLVANAGVAPPSARKTASGLDEIFMVNYMAKFIYINTLLMKGVIPNHTFANNKSKNNPRIIFISSDSHQGASAIDFKDFGKYEDYGVRRAMNNYSYYKLVMNTFATELSRRLTQNGSPDVSVQVICPGPVNSNIIRDAPPPLKIVLRGIFKLFFRSPEKAALPVTYLASSSDFVNTTNQYLHMFNPKRMDEKVYDENEGKKLWEYSLNLWRQIDPDFNEHDIRQ